MKQLLALFCLAAGLACGALPVAGGFFPENHAAPEAPAQQAQSVTFAAAGDHGANAETAASLAALDQSGSSFYLALGDMDYNQIQPDAAWCDYMQTRLPTLGPAFPLQLVSGNHEDQGSADGYIMNHAACAPDRLSSTGTYAAQYYFDYPGPGPLMRVIMIAPDLTIEGITYNYTAGTLHYNWLASAIDAARVAGIPWVVVGMHKVCITAGNKTCEIGEDLLNLVVQKKVDLVLQGHDHSYQRSKQMALSASCPGLVAGSYDGNCVVDDGSDSNYAKGAGTTLVIAGVFGMCCTAVSPADSEAGYFAAMSDTSSGFTKFTVDTSQLQAQFVASTGAYTDSFTISGGAGDGDGDGFSNSAELYLGTNPSDRCGEPNPDGTSASWPADLFSGGVPDSTNKVNITDLSSYLAPMRRINTSPGHPGYSARWDVAPGPSIFPGVINIEDLAKLLIIAPAMFGGQRAFNGPACTG